MNEKIFSNREELLKVSLKVNVSEPNWFLKTIPPCEDERNPKETIVNLIRALRLDMLLSLLQNLALQGLIGYNGMTE